MTASNIESLHKILKDETRRKILLELNDKGNISYTHLKESLNVISTGTLNYHLKVLGDLIEKSPAGVYQLTEKGKLAYRVLTEFPDQEHPIQDRRIFKAWLVLFSATVILTVFTGYFLKIPLERQAITLTILLLSFGFAFYIRLKPSKSGNRAIFIALGAIFIGFALWFLITSVVLFSGLRWQIVNATGNLGDDFTVLSTLIICWIVGGFIGDLIGKKRNYKLASLRL
jgi:DNA-binding transcriptional ArsR family regulator